MLKKLLATPSDLVATIARLALGLMILPHGLAKITHVSGTMHYFDSLGIPAFFGYFAILAESVGSVGLIAGVLSRIAAFGVGTNMVVAILLIHRHVGFYMNWSGQYPPGKEGYEFHLLAIGLALIVLIRGGGAWSLDRVIGRSKD